MDNVNQEELHDEVNNDVVEEETHDRMNAEVQSVKSVEKAAKGGTKQAPKRRADKRGVGETAPKTLAGKVGAMYDKMKGLSKEDVDVLHDMLMDENFVDALHNKEEVFEEDQMEDVSYDFNEDLNALVDSEATLSEEFKEKTAVIFEAAIKSKVRDEINRLEAEYEEKINEETEAVKVDVIDKVDSYLDYVVESWMEENELAIQSGLRAEIAESFMEGFFNLCKENYIEVPEGKVDLVDDLAEQVAELEERLDASVADQIEMAEELEAFQRADIVREFSEGLAETQVEKLASLVADIDFSDEDTFAEKVKTVKESYFSKKSVEGSDLTEEVDGDDAPVKEVSPMMEQYTSVISRFNK